MVYFTLIINSSFHKLFNCTMFHPSRASSGTKMIYTQSIRNISYWLKLMANPLVTRSGKINRLADDSSLGFYIPNKGVEGPVSSGADAFFDLPILPPLLPVNHFVPVYSVVQHI